MNGHLKPVRPPRERRGWGQIGFALDARDTQNTAQQSALEADMVMALGQHIMERAKELDQTRSELAAGDPGLNTILGAIELETLKQVQRVQVGMTDQFRKQP